MLKRRIGIFLIVAVALSVIASFAYAGTSPGVAKEDYKYIMPLSEVHAGMKGYGLTVFKGDKIEKFEVQVLGILKKANNGRDQIFVRLIGGPVTQRKANIIQGMSGSPVYVNGRIIGSVAYGPGGFSREPLGMLTPIEDMLDALDPKLPARPVALSNPVSTQTPLSTPLNVGGELINRIEFRSSASDASPAAKGTLVMTPLMTPLMVSGMSSKGVSNLTSLFSQYGMVPMAGPGGKAAVKKKITLQPGSSVGVALVTGDIDMTSVGTVTYRRGNKLVAFGHPMLEIGPTDAPMTTAWVHEVYPDYQVSFKIASPIEMVGRVFEDRPWSIGGEIGKMPKMIPVKIDVDDKALGRKRTLNVNVVNHPALAPRLILSVASEALTQVHGIPGNAMATVDLSVNADQVGQIERKNVFFEPSEIESAAIDDLHGILSILVANRFHPVDIKSVHMTVTIEEGRKTAAIDRIFIAKSKYQPGETIDVGVDLRPFKGEKFTKIIKVKLPDNVPDGKYNLRIMGGMSSGDNQVMTVNAVEGDNAKASPTPGGGAENIRQIVDKYLERDQNNQLVAKIGLPNPILDINGEKLTNLPDSIATVLKSPKSTGLKLERDEIKVVEPMGYIITGAQSLTINVVHPNASEKESASESAPATNEAPEKVAALADGYDNPVMDDSEDFAASRLSGLSDDSAIPMAEASVAPDSGKKADSSAEAKAETKSEAKPEAKSEGKTAEAKPEPKSVSASGEKPVGRQPSVWNDSSKKEFSSGKFESSSVTDANDVRLVPAMNKIADLPESYVWQVVTDGYGGAFAGTGSNGIIYKIDQSGKSTVFFKTGELQVHSLVKDSGGNLYAGTSPNGKIFKISQNGKGKMIYDAQQKYVVALAADGSDNIYAATGDGGVIYKITPAGETSQFAKLSSNSVISLAFDKTGNLYAGSGKGGVIAKITPDGVVTPVYKADEDSIASLAADGLGNMYAGTGTGKGMIYRISSNGTVKPVFDTAPHTLSLVVDSQNNVYAASDEQIYKVMPDETVAQLDTKNSGAQFISLAITPDGTIIAGTANMGSVYRSTAASSGTYTSSVHDAGLSSTWGRISWIAKNPSGASVTLQTRSGNVPEPDGTWSAWSNAYVSPAGQTVESPAGRYIQYKATLNGTDVASPVLDQVNVSYMTENQSPMLAIKEPVAGTITGKTVTIKWAAVDPDKDSMVYALFYSADEGNTWKPLASTLKPPQPQQEQPKEAAAPAAKEKPKSQQKPLSEASADGKLKIDLGALIASSKSASEVMEKIKAELDKHPDITPEAKERILAKAPAAIAKALNDAGAKPTQSASNGSSGGNDSAKPAPTNYGWDTTGISDGTYMIKVVASDRVSNPVGYLTDEKVVGPIIISNKPPKVEIYKKDAKINADRSLSFGGLASHESIAIAGVQYRIDGSDWLAAAATDGIFDSQSEQFVIATQPVDYGKHTVEVKVIDVAGNSSSTKFPLEISK